MTAVVGILNKKGAAIAADSAVTISRGFRGQKISNSANKMIRLSDDQPIAVMIVGNACLMGIPWDIIIRWYRVKRKGLVLPTLHDYIKDFISFVEENRFFQTDDQRQEWLEYKCGEFYHLISSEEDDMELSLFGQAEEETSPTDESNTPNAIEELRATIASIKDGLSEKQIYPRFVDYPLSEFSESARETILDFMGKDPLIPAKALDLLDEVVECIYDSFRHVKSGEETQLVFSGFGQDETYPVLECVNVNFGLDRRLAYWINEKDVVKISDTRDSALCPYAQTDIMALMTDRIDPYLKQHVCSIAEEEMKGILMTIGFSLREEGVADEISEAVEYLDLQDLFDDFRAFVNNKVLGERHSRFYDSVADLTLTEMAQLAECLVSATALCRHLTFEQESVGGLVDLAIITKKDGFHWLNRKCWYDTPGKDGFNL